MRGERVRAWLLPGLALVLALTALGYVTVKWRAAASRFEQTLSYHEALRAELADMQRDRRILEGSLPRYRELRSAGAFEPEDRLAWITAVDQAVADLGVPHVRYLVNPQAPHQDGALPAQDAWQVRRSRMRVELGLTHTGDLLDLVAALDRQVLGTLSVEGCSLERRVRGASFAAGAVNLNAVCQVDWFTLVDRMAPARNEDV